MYRKFSSKLEDAPLAQKFLIIILPGILLLSALTFLGFLLIVRSSNELLYQTSGELLAYSSQDISQNLASVRNMADFILENEVIQNRLAETKDISDSDMPTKGYSDINATLGTYYEKYKSNYIDYIKLVNSRFSVQKSSIDSHVLPKELEEKIIETARKGDGRLCWITDYTDEYGVFLVRSIRRIDGMKLDELGILIVNINMNRMVEDLSRSHQKQASVYYLIRSENSLICTSPGLHDAGELDYPDDASREYHITRINHKRYFTVKGILPVTEWEYFCLSPYDGMYNNILFFQKLFLVLLAVSLILCLLLTRLLMRPLIQHFNNLMIKIKAFGNEKFEIIRFPGSYEGRQDEIGLLHQQFDSMAQKIQLLIKENYENKILAKDSQLKALEMQINPHFLYNTLDSINWRAKMLKDEQISSMTSSLGKLLRITLNKRAEDSNLWQELELVRYYMNIQQIRYEEQLTFSMNVPEPLLTVYLPKFTLQPLVENAIRYTLEEDSDECEILIEVVEKDDTVIIFIANSDSQFEDGFLARLLCGDITPNGFGIGILNVNKRLELSYGGDYSLNFYNRGKYAVAEITVPCTKRGDNEGGIF